MSKNKPLAENLRPQTLDDFVGQDHLRSQIEAWLSSKRWQNILFFGPPGCGKSSLALLLAQSAGLLFSRVSAPETSLSQLRKQLAKYQLIILDEIHRFSKTQQDFFLPLLETGQIILLATTTENPSFCITKQLLSRLHIFRLQALNKDQLLLLAQKGQSELELNLGQESLTYLVKMSNGDARTLFNLLEYIENLEPEKTDPESLAQYLPEAFQKSDRNGDIHYELASALIKSIRGSDPDAALYYLAGMLEGGEDPRFIGRRLILSASEDVGLADPQALQVAVSCFQAVEVIGMPESFIPLAETVTYLALAPKSNSTYSAYLAAQKEIKRNGLKPVPFHLKNPSTHLHKKWGYGKDYKYPHAYADSWIDQEYLPQGLQNTSFYQPKKQGQEPRLNIWIKEIKRKYRKKS